MKIEKISNISYKAKLINKEYIGKFAGNCSQIYEKQPVSFVKIEPSNAGDINALKYLSDYWQKWLNGNLVTNIYYAACALRNNSKFYIDHEVFALTSQESGFGNLDKDKIIGLVHTCPNDDGSMLIEQLQANPNIINEKNPEYKGIGTGILNSLKFLTNKITCHPTNTKSVVDFYIKNGFKKEQSICNLYIWNK